MKDMKSETMNNGICWLDMTAINLLMINLMELFECVFSPVKHSKMHIIMSGLFQFIPLYFNYLYCCCFHPVDGYIGPLFLMLDLCGNCSNADANTEKRMHILGTLLTKEHQAFNNTVE